MNINIADILTPSPFFPYYVKSSHTLELMQDVHAKVYFAHQPRRKRGLTSGKETRNMLTHYKFNSGLICSIATAFKGESNATDTFSVIDILNGPWLQCLLREDRK